MFEAQQGKHNQEIFRDQIFIQRIINLLLRSRIRTNFLHVRDHEVDSACLNRCLLEFANSIHNLENYVLNNTFRKYQHKLISTVRKTKKKLTNFFHSQHPCGTFTQLELFIRIYVQRIALCWKFWKLCNFKTKASIERHIWYISTLQNNIYRSNEESPTSQASVKVRKLIF